jgi:hypothetical protein
MAAPRRSAGFSKAMHFLHEFDKRTMDLLLNSGAQAIGLEEVYAKPGPAVVLSSGMNDLATFLASFFDSALHLLMNSSVRISNPPP